MSDKVIAGMTARVSNHKRITVVEYEGKQYRVVVQNDYIKFLEDGTNPMVTADYKEDTLVAIIGLFQTYLIKHGKNIKDLIDEYYPNKMEITSINVEEKQNEI